MGGSFLPGGGPGVGGGVGPSGGMPGNGGGGNPAGGNAPSGGGPNGTGGSGPSDGSITDVGQFTPATCATTPTVMAGTIPMVGIATFASDLPGADRALIQFGKTTDYTLEAPVDWSAADHKTLMLGMAANSDYHYRIVVLAGDAACVSADATFKTGALPAGAPGKKTPTKGQSSEAPSPGFRLVAGGQGSRWVVIANVEGEIVWAYSFPGDVISAHMSWDGKYMYARNLGEFNAGQGGSLWRVPMEGGSATQLNLVGGSHHDFTPTPTGIAYIAKQATGECDQIYTAGPDGAGAAPKIDLTTMFAPFKTGQGALTMGEKCHVNAINYHASEKFFTVSDREKDTLIKVSEDGEYMAGIGQSPTMGSPANHAVAAEDGTTWRVQHGHHWYGPNHVLVFSNGVFNSQASKVLHYTISGATATLDWTYNATGNSSTLGNVVKVADGHIFIYASEAGSMHELDENHVMIQSLSGLGKGYMRYRPTLYGPPPDLDIE